MSQHNAPPPQTPFRGSIPLVAALGLLVFVVFLARPRSSDDARRDTSNPTQPAPTAAPNTLHPSADGAPPEPLAADFVQLYDVSSSVHTGTPNDPFLRAVRNFKPSIQALQDAELLLPQRHRIGTVGAASLMQDLVCDFRIDPAGVFKKTDAAVVSRRIDACDKALKARDTERASDIRGALTYAALSLQGARRIVRGVILVTDLQEYIPTAQTPASPDLTNICVVVYSVVTTHAVAHPDSLKARELAWHAQLKSWGARDVRVQSVLGFNAEDLAGFFNGCRR